MPPPASPAATQPGANELQKMADLLKVLYGPEGIGRGVRLRTDLDQINAVLRRREGGSPPDHNRSPLPPKQKDFVGRTTEIGVLVSAIAQSGFAGVSGHGGIGKSSLAAEVAQRLRNRYPDGLFFIDLQRFSHTPARTLEAVLRAFHPLSHLPEEPAAQKLLLHQTLEGRRVLLVLDDAPEGTNLENLAPAPGCAAIVTSRLPLKARGLASFELSPLAMRESAKLLKTMAPTIPDVKCEQIAKLCGYSPLHLRLAGARVREYPAELGPVQDVLTRAWMPDHRGREMALVVEGIIGLLSEQEHRELVLLSVFEGAFDAAAAAAVWNQAIADAARVLDHLARLEFLRREGADRFRLPGGVREYCAAAQDARRAEWQHRQRHAEYYRTVLSQAAEACMRGHGPSLAQGLALYDASTSNVEAAWRWCSANLDVETEKSKAGARILLTLMDAGAPCFELREGLRQTLARTEAAVKAARLLREETGEARYLRRLAGIYLRQGQSRRAAEIGEQLLRRAQEEMNPRAEAEILLTLAAAYAALGDGRGAIHFFEHSVMLAREMGDDYLEARASWGLGQCFLEQGNLDRALAAMQPLLKYERAHGIAEADEHAATIEELRRQMRTVDSAHSETQFL